MLRKNPDGRSGQRWSGIFDQFAASLSSGMGFMSGSGFQVLVGGIIGLSWRQQLLTPAEAYDTANQNLKAAA
ncbi:hypothetical protein [Paracoccus actinidiae]|uniref:hypothetical protein n=1 Tax=Paracoccus actinidiae TaxID=3064531 RepID=UPI0027D2CD7F|nr:hypothetical protein [Paracoccus sp. M09]